MWCQEQLQQGKFVLKCVSSERNMADLMTKHLQAGRMADLLARIGVQRVMRGLVVASLIASAEAKATADYIWLDVFFLVADTLGMLFVCGLLTTLLWCACCRCRRVVATTQRKVVATTTQTEVRQEHGQTQTEVGP